MASGLSVRFSTTERDTTVRTTKKGCCVKDEMAQFGRSVGRSGLMWCYTCTFAPPHTHRETDWDKIWHSGTSAREAGRELMQFLFGTIYSALFNSCIKFDQTKSRCTALIKVLQEGTLTTKITLAVLSSATGTSSGQVISILDLMAY